jgi:VCBS repeat-containing protein
VFDAGVAFTGVSDAILAAITATTTAPISISLTTSPLPAGLAISPTPLVQTGVLPNASAPFDVTVLSGGVAIADGTGVQATFDLNFVETGSQQVLGTIPITVGCTAPDLTPLAVADTNAATEGGAAVTGNVITTAPGTDNEGDGPATVTGASQGASSITLATPFTTAAGGSLTLNANGSYSYTPPAQGNVPTAGLTETFSYTITDADGDPSTTTLSIAVTDVPLPPPPPTGPGTFTLRINAGGRAFTDSAGQVWAADQFFSGGGIFTNERAIAGTDDDALYQTERTGTRNGRGDAFAYNIPVPNGTYAVTLGFADIYWASAGQRVFDVSIEGQEVISDLDIIATVGPKTVLNLTFQAVVADGVLNIDFVSLVDNAKVSTIQVVAVDSSNAAPPNPPPADPGDFALRINAGGPAFTDSAGQVWAADQHFSGGGIFVNERAIAGTNDDPLYQTERTGTRNGPGDAFAYNIPVPNGTYAVTLSFADIYWTSTGRRRFGVSIEGQAVLSDLDIVATVGPKTALNLAFQAVVTDGTLNIDFVSLVDNAKVSAIQVIAVGTSTVALTNATPVGLAAAWEFNEGAGPTVGDASGNGQTGTIANATWTAGHTGAAALAFNGSNASVSTSSSVVKAASSFTLSAWFKTNTTTGAHHILWEGAAGNNGFGEPVNSPASSEMGLTVGSYNQNNKIAFFLGYDVPGNGKGANPIYIVSTSNFTDTTSWHHVAVTVTDLGNGSFSGSLYVDGVLQGTDTGVQNDRSKWGSMVIGKSGAASRYFNGNIDAVRIYSRALSADEIVTDMTTP